MIDFLNYRILYDEKLTAKNVNNKTTAVSRDCHHKMKQRKSKLSEAQKKKIFEQSGKS